MDLDLNGPRDELKREMVFQQRNVPTTKIVKDGRDTVCKRDVLQSAGSTFLYDDDDR